MIKQKVIILNCNSLYEIFDEIKENLSFSVTKYESSEDLLTDKIFDNKDSLIIKKSNFKFNLDKDLDNKNILNLQNYPVSIIKFIELINIQLLKIKFNHQSKFIIKDYELNLNSKVISKKNLILRLTEKEIEIILYLSKNKHKHSVIDLQKNIWGYREDMETHTVETHIYRLRKKILEKFNDNNLILTHLDGYFMK
tara:strand:+ start:1476 stop:2063 length:588 start_codon:yes stop_codon:yes gene_type:complete